MQIDDKQTQVIRRVSHAGLPLALVFTASLCLTACKTKPAEDSGFLPQSQLLKEQRERAPFDRVWIKNGFKKESCKALIIAPVNTGYLLKNTGWAAANPASLILDQSAKDLATFTRDTFVKAFNNDPRHRFPIVSRPGPGVVVLELAIVELVPSHAVISAVGLIAPFAQAPALAVASKIAGKGTSVAIEGRLRDSVTGEVLMMFADREEPPFRIISLKAITWYGDAEDSIETWSKQLVELANTPKTKKVEDASNFTLLPW